MSKILILISIITALTSLFLDKDKVMAKLNNTYMSLSFALLAFGSDLSKIGSLVVAENWEVLKADFSSINKYYILLILLIIINVVSYYLDLSKKTSK